MNIKSKIFLISLYLFITSTYAITFEESMKSAKLYNKDFKIVKEQYNENSYNILSYILGSESMHSLIPSFSYGYRYRGSVEDHKIDMKNSISQYFTNSDVVSVLSWSLSSDDAKKAILKIPELLDKQEELHLKQEEVLMNCIKQYFSCYFAYATCNMNKINSKYRVQAFNSYKNKLKFGASNNVEFLESKANMIKAEIDYEKSCLEKDSEDAGFKVTFNIDHNDKLHFPKKQFFSFVSLEDLQKQAAKYNHKLRQLKMKNSFLNTMLVLAYFPVEATLKYNKNFLSNKKDIFGNSLDDVTTTSFIGLSLNTNMLVTIMKYKSQIKQNSLLIAQLKEHLVTDVEKSYNKLQVSKRDLESCKELVNAKQSIVDMKKTEYQIGKGSEIPLLNAQCNLYEAKLKVLESEYKNWVNYFHLMKVVGKLSFDNLVPDDKVGKQG